MHYHGDIVNIVDNNKNYTISARIIIEQKYQKIMCIVYMLGSKYTIRPFYTMFEQYVLLLYIIR